MRVPSKLAEVDRSEGIFRASFEIYFKYIYIYIYIYVCTRVENGALGPAWARALAWARARLGPGSGFPGLGLGLAPGLGLAVLSSEN